MYVKGFSWNHECNDVYCILIINGYYPNSALHALLSSLWTEIRYLCQLSLIHGPFSVHSLFFIQIPLFTPLSVPLAETCSTNSIWVSWCYWRTGMAGFQQFYEKLKMRDVCMCMWSTAWINPLYIVAYLRSLRCYIIFFFPPKTY